MRAECRTVEGRWVVGPAGGREVLAGMIVAPTVGGIVGVEAGVEMTEGKE